MPRRVIKPFCLCGCGRRVKKLFVRRNGVKVLVRFYNRDCYTRSGARSQATIAAAARVAHKQRHARFQRYLTRLGLKFTQADLLAVFAELSTYYYSLGVEAERHRWRKATAA